jgi:hypothetical protein
VRCRCASCVNLATGTTGEQHDSVNRDVGSPTALGPSPAEGSTARSATCALLATCVRT